MKSFPCLLGFALLLIFFRVAASLSFETPIGTFISKSENEESSYAFLGIPYAEYPFKISFCLSIIYLFTLTFFEHQLINHQDGQHQKSQTSFNQDEPSIAENLEINVLKIQS